MQAIRGNYAGGRDSYIMSPFGIQMFALPKHLLGRGCIVEIQNLKDYTAGVAEASQLILWVKTGVKSIFGAHISMKKVQSGCWNLWQGLLFERKKKCLTGIIQQTKAHRV